MSNPGGHDLAAVRADGWFDRVVAGVPALEKLCAAIGEPLVALSLVAGFRIVSAAIDRGNGNVSSLAWVRDGADGTEVTGSGGPAALRTEVMAVLLGEADIVSAVPAEPDTEALRNCVGQRYLLLAPLFGLTLRRLLVADGDDPRVVVFHDNIEEVVPLRQLRRFLRSRVIDVLQSEKNRSVAIDLEQVDVARAAHAAGRHDEVVARLAGWVAPLMVYLRTPEGASLEPKTRAELARALGLLGEAFGQLGRREECAETLRLAVQYAQDGDAAPEMYRTLARAMMAEGRHAEAIGPLRRAYALEPDGTDVLLDLARCFVAAKRAVAALGCLREAGARGVSLAESAPVHALVVAALGDALPPYEALVAPAPIEPSGAD